MKKVVITIYGPDYASLTEAAEHAANQLKLGTPSENCEWEDKTRVDFTVVEDAAAEYKELYDNEEACEVCLGRGSIPSCRLCGIEKR